MTATMTGRRGARLLRWLDDYTLWAFNPHTHHAYRRDQA